MAFESYPPATLENVWQSLVQGMNNVLRAEGGNDFPLPHHAPRAAETGGELGWRVTPDRAARENAIRILGSFSRAPIHRRQVITTF